MKVSVWWCAGYGPLQQVYGSEFGRGGEVWSSACIPVPDPTPTALLLPHKGVEKILQDEQDDYYLNSSEMALIW